MICRLIKIAAIIAVIVAATAIPVMGDYANTDLNLRKRPDTFADILEVIPRGEEVEVIRRREDWAKVKYDDQIGYVYGEYLQEEELPSRAYLGNYLITAYEETGDACANGNYPTVGYTVAHNTLPFGTVLYIEGVGYRTVEDRGPSSLGNEWLDLYLGDYGECEAWGMQHRDVYLVEDNEEDE